MAGEVEDRVSAALSMVRRWLYMAALRWLKTEPVRSWYLRQKASRRGEGKAAVVGVMRKLALAFVLAFGGRGEKFDAKQLYQSVTRAAELNEPCPPRSGGERNRIVTKGVVLSAKSSVTPLLGHLL